MPFQIRSTIIIFLPISYYTPIIPFPIIPTPIITYFELSSQTNITRHTGALSMLTYRKMLNSIFLYVEF